MIAHARQHRVPSLWRETPKQSWTPSVLNAGRNLSEPPVTRLQSVNGRSPLPLPILETMTLRRWLIAVARLVVRTRILAVTGLLVSVVRLSGNRGPFARPITNAALYLCFAVAYASWTWSQYRDAAA